MFARTTGKRRGQKRANGGQRHRRRFSTHRHGVKEGVAKPNPGNYVDLVVDPAYKDNLRAAVQVLRGRSNCGKRRSYRKNASPSSAASCSIRPPQVKRRLSWKRSAGRPPTRRSPARNRPSAQVRVLRRPRRRSLSRRSRGAGRAAGQGGPERGLPQPGLDRAERDARFGRLRPTPRPAGRAQRGNPLRRLPRPDGHVPRRQPGQGRNTRRLPLPRSQHAARGGRWSTSRGTATPRSSSSGRTSDSWRRWRSARATSA